MPLAKRRRLFTPKKGSKLKPIYQAQDNIDNEVSTARGRLKGALMEMMEPAADDSDTSSDYMPAKRERRIISQDQKDLSSDEEDKPLSQRRSPQRPPVPASYVLKLFDRSVDLSQFSEDTPLYPICRAWMANQPKANYKDLVKKQVEESPPEDSIDLPGPEGPVISRIPSLLPEQKACNKDNIHLNNRDAPPPSREELLQQHMSRWVGVRNAWLQQAALVESRYAAAQAVLNSINNNL